MPEATNSLEKLQSIIHMSAAKFFLLQQAELGLMITVSDVVVRDNRSTATIWIAVSSIRKNSRPADVEWLARKFRTYFSSQHSLRYTPIFIVKLDETADDIAKVHSLM